MAFLIPNIFNNPVALFEGIGKYGIAVAPSVEQGKPFRMLFYPFGRFLFDNTDELADSNCWVDFDTHVKMVWHGVDAVYIALLFLGHTYNICVQIALVAFRDGVTAVFGPPDNVICQTNVAHTYFRIMAMTYAR